MPTMIAISGGSFQLGANRPNRQPVTVVVGAFELSETAVSLAEWVQVRDLANGLANPNRRYSIPDVGFADGPNHPVQGVSLLDCAAWCNALSERDGFAPRYVLADDSTYKGGHQPGSRIRVNQAADGYRIPSEPEWEYVAREGGARPGDQNAGSINYAGAWPFTRLPGNDLPPSERIVWTNGPPRTVRVDMGTPNALGIYHLVGNTWEWCQHLIRDPRGEYGADEAHELYSVIRGGSCVHMDTVTRPNTREVCQIFFRLRYLGFRPARG